MDDVEQSEMETRTEIMTLREQVRLLRPVRATALRADNAAALMRGPPAVPAVAVVAGAPPGFGLGPATLLHVLCIPGLGTSMLGWISDDTAAATALRGTCTFARALVAEHPWADTRTCVWWPARWRAAFPAAVTANVGRELDKGLNLRLFDADFVHFRGLHALNMSWCREITDAAFTHLAGIHTLIMWGCGQVTITDAAFLHLAGIHTLNMSECDQETITDEAFVHLAGIRTLDMSGCNQDAIMDAAFAHLAGIHTLNMSSCGQATITAAGRVRLTQAGISDLRM